MTYSSPPAANPSLSRRLVLYARLLRLDKPIGNLLLLWPTMGALWIASGGIPSWHHFFIFFFGSLLMRAVGCALNDAADRDFDKHVKRTANRPLTTGEISLKEALLLAGTLAVLALLLALTLPRQTQLLTIPAIILAASYPFFKRFFAIPQAYLGVAFGFGILMAFSAVLHHIPPVAWVLLAANVFWSCAYDTEYAMVDRDDDLLIGMRTAAITFGRFDVLAIMICYTCYFALTIWAGVMANLGLPFFVGMAVAIGCAIYHYFLIRGREREPCFKAFLHNNWLGAVIFLGIALDYAIR